MSQSESVILRHSFLTGHTTTVASGANEPTAIIKAGHTLVWEQQAGYTCKRNPDTDQIMSLSLTGSDTKPRVVLNCLNDETTGGLVYADGYLYIAMHDGIGRLKLKGRHFDRHFIHLSRQPEGDSLDGLATDGTRLYFSRCDDGTIGRVGRNGKALSYDFISTGYKSCPQAIATGNGHIYWSDLNPIGRARMNGTHVQRSWLSIRSNQGPFNLAADAHHIYWDWGGAAGSPTYIGRVRPDNRAFTKRWAHGQGAFLLTTKGAGT